MRYRSSPQHISDSHREHKRQRNDSDHEKYNGEQFAVTQLRRNSLFHRLHSDWRRRPAGQQTVLRGPSAGRWVRTGAADATEVVRCKGPSVRYSHRGTPTAGQTGPDGKAGIVEPDGVAGAASRVVVTPPDDTDLHGGVTGDSVSLVIDVSIRLSIDVFEWSSVSFRLASSI